MPIIVRRAKDTARLWVMSNYLISIDWLQYYCHSQLDHLPDPDLVYVGKHKDSSGNFRNYKVKPTDKHSHIYIYNYAITWHNIEVAYIGLIPRTPILAPSSASVKISNYALYRPDWAFYVTDICDAFSLNPISITRLDLCYDCKSFKDDYLPNRFIQDYVKAQIDDSGATIVRERSNKFYTVARRIALRDDDVNKQRITGYATRWEYLRWGTRDSGCCVYLYNKSLELKESGKKEYIKRAWRDAGLNPDEGAPIYRVEISIKAKAMDCERSDTPRDICGYSVRDISALALDDISSQAKLEEVFFSYADHYFAFRLSEGQHYVKDMPRLELLEKSVEPTMKPRQISHAWHIGNSERKAAACLRRFVTDFPDMPITWRADFGRVSDILDKVAGVKLAAHIAVTDEEIIKTDIDVFASGVEPADYNDAWHTLVKQARATDTQRKYLQIAKRGMLRAVYEESVVPSLRIRAAARYERKHPSCPPPWDVRYGEVPSPRECAALVPDWASSFAVV